MAYFTRQVAPNGSLMVVALAGVSQPRRHALQAAGQPIPANITIQGLVDTGASNTCVDPSVLKQLGLTPTGSTLMSTPSTGTMPVQVDTYDIGLLIYADQNNPPLTHHTIAVTESELLAVQGFHVLIGRDILGRCLLIYDGQAGIFSLAF